MTGRAELFGLLKRLFDVEELRIHLRHEPQGDAIHDGLPQRAVEPGTFVDKAIDSIVKHQVIDISFFERLEHARPLRAVDIHAVRDVVLGQSRTRPAPPHPPDQPYAERVAMLEVWRSFLDGPAHILSLVAASGAGKSQFLRARYTELLQAGDPVALVDLEPCRAQPSSRVALLNALLVGLRHLLSPTREEEIRAALRGAERVEPRPSREPRETLNLPAHEAGIPSVEQLMSDPHPPQRATPRAEWRSAGVPEPDPVHRAQQGLLGAACPGLVLFIDAVEAISVDVGRATQALDVLLEEIVPDLEARGVRVVLAGQVLLQGRCKALSGSLFDERPFPDELSEEELSALLQERGATSVPPARRWRFPLLGGLAARLADLGRVDLGEVLRADAPEDDLADWRVTGEAVGHILDHVGDPWLRRALREGCVLRTLTLPALEAVLELPAPEDARTLLSRWSNLQGDGADRWTLHPHLRAILHEALERQDEPRFRRTHELARDHFDRIATTAEGQELGAAWIEAVWHELGAAPGRWSSRLLVTFARALVRGDAGTREALLRCGEDEPQFRRVVERHRYDRERLRQGLEALASGDLDALADLVVYLLGKEAVQGGVPAGERAELLRFVAERRLDAGRLEEAAGPLKQARDLDPDAPDQLRLDLALLTQTDPPGALASIEAFLERATAPPALAALEEAFRCASALDEMPWLVERLDPLAGRFPDDETVGLALASALSQVGRVWLAVQVLERLAERGQLRLPNSLSFRAQLWRRLGNLDRARAAWLEAAEAAVCAGDHELRGDALLEAGAPAREVMWAWESAVQGEEPRASALRKLVRTGLKEGLLDVVQSALDAAEGRKDDDLAVACQEGRLRLALRREGCVDLDPIWERLGAARGAEAALAVATEEAVGGAPGQGLAVYRAVLARTEGEARREALVQMGLMVETMGPDLADPRAAWLEVLGGLEALPASPDATAERRALEVRCVLLCRVDRIADAVAALLGAGAEVDRIQVLVEVERRLRVAGMPELRDRWWVEGMAALRSAPRDEREAQRLETWRLFQGAVQVTGEERLEWMASLPVELVDPDMRWLFALLLGVQAAGTRSMDEVVAVTGRYLSGGWLDLSLAAVARQICGGLAGMKLPADQPSSLEFALELYLRSARRGYAHAAEALELASDLCFRRLRRRQRAAALVDQALALQPNRRGALTLAVEIHVRAGELQRAESYLKRLDEMAWNDDRHEVARQARALWLCVKGDFNGVILLLEGDDPPETLNARAHDVGERLAAVGQGHQKRQLRIAFLQRCAQRWPDHPLGLSARFSIAVRRRDLREGGRLLALLERVQSPGLHLRHRYLWMARSGQQEAVFAELKDAGTGDLAVEPLTALADDLFDHDAKNEALALYELLVRRPGPHRHVTMVRLGDLRRGLAKDLDGSRAILEQALAENPNDPGLWFSLQRTLVCLKDYDGAVRAAEEELTRSAEAPMIRDVSMAYILGARGESRAAAEHMLKLYGWDRFDAFLATVEERIAQDATGERAAEFMKVVMLDLASRPDTTGTVARLEWLVGFGDLDAAEALLAKIDTGPRSPNAPHLLWYQVELLARRGELAQAADLIAHADEPQATLGAVFQLLCSHGAHLVCANLCEAVAARRGPEEAEAWTHAGLSLLNPDATIEDRARSVRALRRALDLNPDDQRAWGPLIQELLRARGDVAADEAMARWRLHGYRLRVGDTFTPHSVMVDLACGREAHAVGDLFVAAGPSAIRQILPALHGALVRLGRPDLVVRLQEALAERHRAPLNHEEQMLLAQVQLALGDLDGAERSLDCLSRAGLEGADRVLQVLRSSILVLRARVEEAAVALADNTEVQGLADPLEHLAKLAIDRHGLGAGICFLEAMAQQPQMDPGPLLSAAAGLVERSDGPHAARSYLARVHADHPTDLGIVWARLRLLSRIRAWNEADETLALLCATPPATPQHQLETEALHAYVEACRGHVRQALQRMVQQQRGRAAVQTLTNLARWVGEDGHRWGMDLLFVTFEYFSEELSDDEQQPLARVRHLLERGDLDEAEHRIEALRLQPPLESLNDLLIWRGVAIAMRGDIPAAVRALDAGRGPRDRLARLDHAISLLLPLPHGKAAAARLLEHIGRERLREGPDSMLRAAEIWRVNEEDHEAAWSALDLALNRCAGPDDLRRVHHDRLIVALAGGSSGRAQRVAEALDELASTDTERDQAIAAMVCAALLADKVPRAKHLVARMSPGGRTWGLSCCARWLWLGGQRALAEGLFDRLGVALPEPPHRELGAALFEVAWALAWGGDATRAHEALLAGRSPQDGHEDLEALAQGLRAAGCPRMAAELYVASGRSMQPAWREDWLAALDVLKGSGEREARLALLRRAALEVDGPDIQMELCLELERTAKRASDDDAQARWRETAGACAVVAEYMDDVGQLDFLLLATSLARRRAHDLALAGELAEQIEGLHPELGLPRLELARNAEVRGDAQGARKHLEEALRREQAHIWPLEDAAGVEQRLLMALLLLKLCRPGTAADTLSCISAIPEAQGMARHIQRLRGVIAGVEDGRTPEPVDAPPAAWLVWLGDLEHDIDALQHVGEITLEQRDALIDWLNHEDEDSAASGEVL